MKSFLSLALLLAFASPALAGEYTLDIDKGTVKVGGRSESSLTINGQVPGPLLRWKDGEDVTIHVHNHLDETASIHWHGLILPGNMDGVPGLNGFQGIPAHSTFTYRFPVKQSGTYWYHSHSGTQEQDGLYGPIIIEPKAADVVKADRDYVVVLSDFTTEDPDRILKNLKVDAGYYNFGKRTVGDFFRDAGKDGIGATLKDRLSWADMRMDPTDLADVSQYTFLINGHSAADNWTGLFKPGDRVRLRFINASSMSFYDVRIPGLKMKVVQADGQNVEPVPVDEFRIAVAETYDVIVTPKDDQAYTIFAEPLDRSGYARGTLAPREGMRGPLPAQKPRTILTMADMGMMEGMDHSAMDHASMGHEGIDHTKTDMGEMDTSGIDHSSMLHGGMDIKGMDHGSMQHGSESSREGLPRGWADASTPPGQKQLSYADLRSLEPQKDTRTPERTIEVRLGGNMERYIWTINGEKWTKPIDLNYGERVRLTFINETMMAHPMHLHGMFWQLENGQPVEKLPNKHVVIVEPGKSYSVLLTADAPGEWAFHCHLLYHMESGMMTKAVVATLPANKVPAEARQEPVAQKTETPMHHEHGGHHAH